MNLQQLYDLRLKWKSSPHIVVHKESALEVLDEYIALKSSSDAQKGTSKPFKDQVNVFTFPGGDAS